MRCFRASRSLGALGLCLGFLGSCFGLWRFGHVSLWFALPLVVAPGLWWVSRGIPRAIGRLSVRVLLVCMGLFGVSYVGHVVDDYLSPVLGAAPYALHAVTVNGRAYTHDTLCADRENGLPVWTNLCEEELRGALSARGFSGEGVYGVAARYLTSLGYRKDSVGASLLTEGDWAAIGAGARNHRLVGRWGLYVYLWDALSGVEGWYLGSREGVGSLSGFLISTRESWRSLFCGEALEGSDLGSGPVGVLALARAWGVWPTGLALVLVVGLSALGLGRGSLLVWWPYWVVLPLFLCPLGAWCWAQVLVFWQWVLLWGLSRVFPEGGAYLCPSKRSVACG